MENEIAIKNNDGVLTVSSVQVAIDFGKEKRAINRDIKNLTAQNCAVKEMFIESSYINERGRRYKCYEMTRDGFSLLVMGFTGKKALEWKLKYIEAFNKMEQFIKYSNGAEIQDCIANLIERIENLEHQQKQLALSKKPAKKFIPPTVEEVEDYCDYLDEWIDCERFVDYYESIGWLVGNKPMKDWKATVRNWIRTQRY